MKLGSPFAVAGGTLLVAVFVVRALTGVPATWAYARGRAAERDGRYAEAGPMIDRGAIGANRSEGLWRAGRARLEIWDEMPSAQWGASEGADALRVAATRILEGRAVTPGSTWFVSALGDVYFRRETVERARSVVDMAMLDRGPWAFLGDDGRIAIGLCRTAIDREPNRFEYRDQLVFLLESNGLHEEALAAMEESARVLPDFGAHPDFTFESLPRDLVEAFWRSARSVGPGEAPLLFRERHLLSLGILGRRLGHLEEAERDLREALQSPGTVLYHAEDAFHLGLVLLDLGRFDEAEAMLGNAVRESVFGPGVADARARMAAKRERWPEALVQLRELRRFQPRDVGVLLRFASAAQKAQAWDQAEESLRWAILVHPEEPAPRQALVELFLAQGETARARGALDEYARSFDRPRTSQGAFSKL